MIRADARPLLATTRRRALCSSAMVTSLRPPLSQEIEAGIAGSRFVVVPDCGHVSTMTQPKAVNLALVEWITG
jgi:pimeloyl-ACP methyl ester carboxylesterase